MLGTAPILAATYEIKPGDTLWKIAQAQGTTIENLVAMNPEITDIDLIIAGDQMNIPDPPIEAPKQEEFFKAPLAKGSQIIQFGERYLGKPYRLGGGRRDNQKYFDCSGFTWYVFKKNGIDISMGGARQQSQYGSPVKYEDLAIGDLVFFSTKATMKYPKDSVKRIGHVGIYAGNGKVLHTYSKESGGVRYSDMSKGWWKEHFVKAKRVL